MKPLTNTIQNNALAAFSQTAPKNVLNAIQKASAKTGVNFAYMVQQAAAESSFNPTAKAKTSSASGLYQFIESTWMSMVDKYGDKYGIDTQGKSKKDILALRNDAQISANMAAEFAGENERYLNNNWGGDVGPTELYFAHFMGAGGASAFLKAKDKNPLQPAADLFPQAARANRNVFFDKSGRAKSMDEVYAFFDKKFAIKDAPLPLSNDVLMAEEDMGQESADTGAELIASSVFTTGANRRNIPPPPRLDLPMQIGSVKRKSSESDVALGQIPGNYQNLLRSPYDLMKLTQLDVNRFFQ